MALTPRLDLCDHSSILGSCCPTTTLKLKPWHCDSNTVNKLVTNFTAGSTRREWVSGSGWNRGTNVYTPVWDMESLPQDLQNPIYFIFSDSASSSWEGFYVIQCTCPMKTIHPFYTDTISRIHSCACVTYAFRLPNAYWPDIRHWQLMTSCVWHHCHAMTSFCRSSTKCMSRCILPRAWQRCLTLYCNLCARHVSMDSPHLQPCVGIKRWLMDTDQACSDWSIHNHKLTYQLVPDAVTNLAHGHVFDITPCMSANMSCRRLTKLNIDWESKSFSNLLEHTKWRHFATIPQFCCTFCITVPFVGNFILPLLVWWDIGMMTTLNRTKNTCLYCNITRNMSTLAILVFSAPLPSHNIIDVSFGDSWQCCWRTHRWQRSIVTSRSVSNYSVITVARHTLHVMAWHSTSRSSTMPSRCFMPTIGNVSQPNVYLTRQCRWTDAKTWSRTLTSFTSSLWSV